MTCRLRFESSLRGVVSRVGIAFATLGRPKIIHPLPLRTVEAERPQTTQCSACVKVPPATSKAPLLIRKYEGIANSMQAHLCTLNARGGGCSHKEETKKRGSRKCRAPWWKRSRSPLARCPPRKKSISCWHTGRTSWWHTSAQQEGNEERRLRSRSWRGDWQRKDSRPAGTERVDSPTVGSCPTPRSGEQGRHEGSCVNLSAIIELG